MAVLHPEVLWAQRSSETDAEKNIVYVTVNLPDIVESSLKFDLQPTKFSFAAKTGNAEKGIPEKEWAIDVDLFDEISPEDSSKVLTSRSFKLILRKKEVKLEFWPRLTKERLRGSTIKTDFDKWVDEDEQNAVVDVPDDDFSGMGGMGGGGFDPSMLAGMGGMGGMGGMPGMGGMGGLPGMGGLGGDGAPDFAKMMAEMGQGAAAGGDPSAFAAGSAEDDDDDDDGPPPLEDSTTPAPSA